MVVQRAPGTSQRVVKTIQPFWGHFGQRVLCVQGLALQN